MRGGHIPGSKSVPFDTVLTEGKAGLKSPEIIRSIFEGTLPPLPSRRRVGLRALAPSPCLTEPCVLTGWVQRQVCSWMAGSQLWRHAALA